MTGEFEWANYRRLLEHPFFERTMYLYQMEKGLQTPIPDSMHWTRRFEYPWILDKIEPGSTILDVGAGATALQFMIAGQGNAVTSADIDTGAIDWINSRTATQLVKNPKTVFAGLPNLPFGTGRFETVICISVLEHLPKDQVLQSIEELIRISSKNVLITMDVALAPHIVQTDMTDLTKITKALGFECPEMDRYAIVFNIDKCDFGVACLRLCH